MKTQELEILLTNAGMDQKEARIYLFLLDNGPQKASFIYKDLNWKKGNTYALLDKLIEKELVVKKNLLFYPKPPLLVLQKLEENNQHARAALEHFKTLLPSLMSNYKLSVGKPTIRYFEGEAGIREVFEDIYAKKQGENIVYGCVDLEKSDEVFPKYITSKMIPKRIKNKLKAISLVADSPQAKKIKKEDKKHLRQTILLNKEAYPLPAEIDVYEDKIAMLTFSQGDFLGLIIENQDLATTLKSVFKLAMKVPAK